MGLWPTGRAGWVLLCAVGFGMPGAGWTADQASLVLERTIPLTDVSGRIDHMALDPRRMRLMVAELGNGSVDVIDLAAGKAVHRIVGLREPQGIGYVSKSDLLAVASAGDGSVRLFRGADYAPTGIVDLHDDADNIRVDPLTGRLVVGYGSGGLAVIDPASRLVVSRTTLPAHPEGFQVDPVSHRAFVNLPDARQVAVVDLASERLISSWPIPDARANFPMARQDLVLAVMFRTPPQLVLLDAQSGAVQARSPACGDADDVFFDARRERLYVSCGEGVVDVWHRDTAGYRLVDRIKTASGARTSLFVPELDRLFVAARAGFFGLGSDAAILVFQPRP